MNVHDHIRSPSTATRLGAALLGYLLAVTLLVTLLPFRFAVPEHVRLVLVGPWRDAAANVVLFLPLGFLARLVRPGGPGGTWRVALAAAAVSVLIESLQLLIPARHSSPLDVIANTAGAWLGAWLHDAVARRRRLDARLVRQLGLELPLMGLLYLLVPLLWLSGLARGDGWIALAPTAGLALFGASLLATIQRLHFGPHGITGARGIVIGAATWYVAGTFPTMRGATALPLLAIGVLVVLVVHRAAATPAAPMPPGQRRFEVAALRRAAPLFALSLLALAAQPLVDGAGPWRGALGIPLVSTGAGDPLSTRAVLRVMEAAAAFTLLGYFLAELRSRREDSFGAARWRLLRWGAPLVAVAEGIRGFAPDGSASVVTGVALVAATLYGGWLYHLQRAHVQRLLVLDAADGPGGWRRPAPVRRSA